MPLRFAPSDGGGPFGAWGASHKGGGVNGGANGSVKRLVVEEVPALLDADALLARLEQGTLEVQAVLGSAHLGPLHETALAWLGRFYHTVTASVTYGHSLCYMRSQPLS